MRVTASLSKSELRHLDVEKDFLGVEAHLFVASVAEGAVRGKTASAERHRRSRRRLLASLAITISRASGDDEGAVLMGVNFLAWA